MAVYNAEEHLAEAIDSILDQRFRDFELIVADGASADSTVSLLESYKGEIFFFSEPDEGVYDAWNKALRFARGEWIMFIGGDDFFASRDSLSAVVPFLKPEHTQREKYIYNIVDVISKETKKTISQDGIEWHRAKPLLSRFMSVPHCGAFHHRSLFYNSENFDIGFKIAGDYDFLLRIVKKGEDCLFLPFPIIKMREGGLSTNSKMRVVLARENIKALRKNGLKIGVYQYFTLLKAKLLLFLGNMIGHKILDRCIGIVKNKKGKK